MMKCLMTGILVCALTGCATPQPAGAPTVVAAKKHQCDTQFGSHIVDQNNCEQSDPWVRHTVITGHNGEPYQTQGD